MATTTTATPSPMVKGKTEEARAALHELQTQDAAISARLAAGRAEQDVIRYAEFRIVERGLEFDLLVLEEQIAKASAAVEVARDRDKQALHRMFHEQKRALMPAVVKALTHTQDLMEQLRVIELREHQTTNDFLDMLSWREFLPSARDGTYAGRLEIWLDLAKAQGLLD